MSTLSQIMYCVIFKWWCFIIGLVVVIIVVAVVWMSLEKRHVFAAFYSSLFRTIWSLESLSTFPRTYCVGRKVLKLSELATSKGLPKSGSPERWRPED